MKKINTKNLLRALGNEIRLKLIFCLSKPHSVTELLDQCHLSQSALSQHLKILKDCGVAQCRKEGKQQIYFVSNKEILEVSKKLINIK